MIRFGIPVKPVQAFWMAPGVHPTPEEPAGIRKNNAFASSESKRRQWGLCPPAAINSHPEDTGNFKNQERSKPH